MLYLLGHATSSLIVQPIVQAPTAIMHVHGPGCCGCTTMATTLLTAEVDNGIFPSSLLAQGAPEATPFQKGGFGQPTAAGDRYQGSSAELNLDAMVSRFESTPCSLTCLVRLSHN